jgi:uncharacterized protein YciU (UPF0263 family)
MITEKLLDSRNTLQLCYLLFTVAPENLRTALVLIYDWYYLSILSLIFFNGGIFEIEIGYEMLMQLAAKLVKFNDIIIITKISQDLSYIIN